MGTKKVTETPEQSHFKYWHRTFSTRKHPSGWTISYNETTGRVELKNDNQELMISDISSISCKNIAQIRFNIDEKDWN